jgi:hypothetical protein
MNAEIKTQKPQILQRLLDRTFTKLTNSKVQLTDLVWVFSLEISSMVLPIWILREHHRRKLQVAEILENSGWIKLSNKMRNDMHIYNGQRTKELRN